jgi:hypothetical protein
VADHLVETGAGSPDAPNRMYASAGRAKTHVVPSVPSSSCGVSSAKRVLSKNSRKRPQSSRSATSVLAMSCKNTVTYAPAVAAAQSNARAFSPAPCETDSVNNRLYSSCAAEKIDASPS